MATNKTVAEVVIKPSMDMTAVEADAKKIQSILAHSGAIKIDKAFVDDIIGTTTKAADTFNALMVSGAKVGFGPAFVKKLEEGGGKFRTKMVEGADAAVKILKDLQDQQVKFDEKIEKAKTEEGKDRLRQVFAGIQKQMKAEAHAQAKIVNEADQQMRKELVNEEIKVKRSLRGVEEEADLRKSYLDFTTKRWGEQGLQTVTIIGETLDSALSESFDPKNFAGFIQSLSKGMKTAGAGLVAKGGESGGTGAAIGQLLGGMGKLVGILAGVAAGFSAIVGVLIKADAQAADFNKTILEGGSALDLNIDHTWQMSRALDVLQRAATDVNNNMKWRTAAKEQLAIIAGFNQAGFTIKEMVGNIKDAHKQMERFREVTSTALIYANLLGETAPKIAADMATAMEDFGLSLKGVKDQFAAIAEGARISGFSTKDFYSKVLEITSGMSLYNVRLAEAAGLLARVGKILGKQAGADFLKSIAGSMKGEGIEERIKRVMLTGQGRMKKIYETSAKNTALQFSEQLVTATDPEKLRQSVADAFKAVGVTGVDIPGIQELTKSGTSRSKFAQEMVQTLQTLKPDQQEELLSRIALKNNDLARTMRELIKVSQGSKGSLMDMAVNLDSLDLGGKMAAEMSRFSTMFSAPMHKWTAMQVTAYSKQTGVSMEQYKQLAIVSERLHGNFTVLEKQKAEMEKLVKAGKTDTQEYKDLVSAQQETAKATGAMVTTNENGQLIISRAIKDASGQYVGAVGGQLKGTQEYIQSQGDTLKKAAERGAPAHVRFAEMTAAKTTELTKIMKIGVEGLLQKLHTLVAKILSILGVGQSKEEQQAKTGAMDVLAKDFEKSMTARQKINQQIAEAATKLKGATTTKDISFFQEQIKLLKDRDNIEKEKAATTEKAMSVLQNAGKTGLEKVQDLVDMAKGAAMGGVLPTSIAAPTYKKMQVVEEKTATKEEEGKRRVGIGRTMMVGLGKVIGYSIGWVLGSREILQQTSELKPQLKLEEKQVAQGKALRKVIAKAEKDKLDAQVQARRKYDQDMMSKWADAWAKKYADENLKSKENKKIQDVASALGFAPEKIKEFVGEFEKTGRWATELTDKMKATTVNAPGGKGTTSVFEQIKGLTSIGRSADDFLLRLTNSGRMSLVSQFNPADSLSVVGSKPGGSLANAAQGLGTSQQGAATPAGMRPIINITINGNEERAYKVVRKALVTAGVT